MKVKLCGFTEENSLKTAVASNCDFLGFVFFEPSPRNISLSQAAKLKQFVPTNIAKVAVTVDANFERISEIIAALEPDFFQFHGQENLEYIEKFKRNFPKISVIKAFKVSSAADLEQVSKFENICDYLLFDSKNAGSGASFDWSILANFLQKNNHLITKTFLSGGININNLATALQETKVQLIDLSSGLEEQRGVKSVKLIADFMNKIKNHVC